MQSVITGLERLINEKELQSKIKGNFGLLCHSASITSDYVLAVEPLIKIFGDRLKKIFGPQHGFVTDVQDNMIESKDFAHPYFKRPVLSLYGNVRKPTSQMLSGLDSLVIDLQDVGTRVYTYIWTLYYVMQACGVEKIKVIILDRPNPIGGEQVEGNILDKKFASFVGLESIPMRHGLTMGEMAKFFKEHCNIDCDLEIIPMKNYKRSLYYQQTGLPWVPPSPNLPTVEGALPYVGTVLFEGTNVSEGRGTTRSLEVIGFPGLEPFSFRDHFLKKAKEFMLEGFILRPINFIPTFQKHHNISCGGVHIHVTNPQRFNSWRLGQLLNKELYHYLKDKFEWNTKPYEYQFEGLAIDYINGTDKLRYWIQNNGSYNDLEKLELEGRKKYLDQRENILIYS